MDRQAALMTLGVPRDARGTRVEAWLDLLEQWRGKVDLTAARTADELHDLMLADALVLAARVPERARVVDVGTGAGAPGLALALVRPDLAITLVEPLGKRAAFLRTVLGTVGRTDVELLRDRGEAVARDRGRAWDVAISRATLPPNAWIPLGLALAPRAWALLAKEEPPVVPGAVVEADVAYAWPLTGAARRAALYAGGTLPGGDAYSAGAAPSDRTPKARASRALAFSTAR